MHACSIIKGTNFLWYKKTRIFTKTKWVIVKEILTKGETWREFEGKTKWEGGENNKQSVSSRF